MECRGYHLALHVLTQEIRFIFTKFPLSILRVKSTFLPCPDFTQEKSEETGLSLTRSHFVGKQNRSLLGSDAD